MAKEDFCFTYYDGDALRDMSHMNRLERGAYNDVVLQQRKFGRMTLDQLKKILGRDFQECWPAIELILIFDDGKYYVEWLDTSIKKMRTHSKLQSDRIKNKNKAESEPDVNQTSTKHQPSDYLKGNEDGNEDGIEIKNEKESETFESTIAIREDQVNISWMDQSQVLEALMLDEIYIEQLQMTHRGKDIKLAFGQCYIHHSNAPNPPQNIQAWKQKLNTWLSNTRTNGTSKKAESVNSRREAFARRHGTSPDG